MTDTTIMVAVTLAGAGITNHAGKTVMEEDHFIMMKTEGFETTVAMPTIMNAAMQMAGPETTIRIPVAVMKGRKITTPAIVITGRETAMTIMIIIAAMQGITTTKAGAGMKIPGTVPNMRGANVGTNAEDIMNKHVKMITHAITSKRITGANAAGLVNPEDIPKLLNRAGEIAKTKAVPGVEEQILTMVGVIHNGITEMKTGVGLVNLADMQKLHVAEGVTDTN